MPTQLALRIVEENIEAITFFKSEFRAQILMTNHK